MKLVECDELVQQLIGHDAPILIGLGVADSMMEQPDILIDIIDEIIEIQPTENTVIAQGPEANYTQISGKPKKINL